jgi:hypothetical protein
MIVQVGETRKTTFKNSVITGLLCKIYVTAAATNTAIAYAAILAQNIFVRVTLKRGGQSIPIFMDNLRLLNAVTNFTNIKGLLSMANSSGYTNLVNGAAVNLVAPASGVAEVDLLPYVIKFMGGCISLAGTDALEVEVTFNASSLSSAISASGSYMDITETKNSLKYETACPELYNMAISANEQRISEPLGHGVTKILWMNFDQSNQTTAEQIIQSLNVSSKQHSFNKTYIDLMTEQMDYYNTPLQAYQRGQSIVIYDGPALDDVKIDLLLNSGNVNASENYLCVYRQSYNGNKAVAESARQSINTLTAAANHGVGAPSNVAAVALNTANSSLATSVAAVSNGVKVAPAAKAPVVAAAMSAAIHAPMGMGSPMKI